jgi:hypothetical protein
MRPHANAIMTEDHNDLPLSIAPAMECPMELPACTKKIRPTNDTRFQIEILLVGNVNMLLQTAASSIS